MFNDSVIPWGVTRGIILGISQGIRLEHHPQGPAKVLLNSTGKGSVGIPDSLAHKRVNTSGWRVARARYGVRGCWALAMMTTADRCLALAIVSTVDCQFMFARFSSHGGRLPVTME